MPTRAKKPIFTQAAVKIFCRHSHRRGAMREILRTLGFRHIDHLSDFGQMRDAILARPPDLVFLDLDQDARAICDLVRDVRRSTEAMDPFLSIVAATGNPAPQKVKQALESGIDDLIVMPTSVAQIQKRINVLVFDRKGFVVTTSYVGPDRRKTEDIREDTLGLGTITVPNNLRYKTIGDATAAVTREAVAAVRAQIAHHRVNRYAQRIGRLADKILTRVIASETAHEEIPRSLNEAMELLKMLAADLEAQGNTALREICDSMSRVIDDIRGTPTRRSCELLKVHALAANASLRDHDDAADLVITALNEARATLTQARRA